MCPISISYRKWVHLTSPANEIEEDLLFEDSTSGDFYFFDIFPLFLKDSPQASMNGPENVSGGE